MTSDWAASGRRDTYELWAVDPFSLKDVSRVEFEPAQSSLTFAKDSETGASATLRVWAGSWDMANCDRLLRLKHVACVGDTVRAETVGTYFVRDPPATERFGRWAQDLACYSTQLRYTEDVLDDDLYVAAGSKVIPVVAKLAEEVGGTVSVGLRAAEGDTGLRAAKLFRVGESRSETMQTLLALVGCRMSADEDGRTLIERDRAASEMEPCYEFEVGQGCVCESPAEWEQVGAGDWKNRIVAYWSRDSLPDPDDGMGYAGRVVVDLDRGHRHSYENTGRRATQLLELTEPCTQAELAARARKTLASLADQPRYVVLSHVGVPGLRVGRAVTLRRASGTWKCEVDQMEVDSLGPLMMTRTKLRVLE